MNYAFFRIAIVIDIGFNILTGSLSYSLECLKNVDQLNFVENLLYGQVPEVMCSLRNSEFYFCLIIVLQK